MTQRIAVVGAGIAGVAVAKLAPSGAHVELFDAHPERSATRVATGLVNPVVLKRRRVVWRAAEALAEARAFYPDSVRGTEPIYEVLRTPEEVNDWAALADHPALGPYLGPLVELPAGIMGICMGTVNQSFRVDLKAFADAVRREFSLNEEVVESLEPLPQERWQLNGREFDAVVLCEGYQARWAEHFWGDLRFARTSGQGLRVSLARGPQVMLHRSHFLLPEADGTYQLGASYGWGISSGTALPPPPQRGQTDELLDSARAWLQSEITVHRAWTGIRPTTSDRRPRWGWHPEHPSLGLLNGLGSRGTLHAPLLARELWAQKGS
jgi:glycine oxidase